MLVILYEYFSFYQKNSSIRINIKIKSVVLEACLNTALNTAMCYLLCQQYLQWLEPLRPSMYK
jgi:hypothetical protein